MKKIFYIQDNIPNQISYYHILLFLLALPFDRIYSTVILISFCLHTIIHINKIQLQNLSKTTFFLQSVFYVSLVSSIYSLEPQAGFDMVSRQLAIFLFPLAFSISSLDLSKYRSQLMGGFSIACTLTITYLFLDAFHILWYHNLPFKILFSPLFVNHNFSRPINIHAAYLSMFVVLSFVHFLNSLITTQAFGKKIFIAICLCILGAGLLLLSSKSAWIALFLICLTFPFLLLKGRKRFIYLVVFTLATLFLVTVLLSVNVFKNRFLVELNNDLFGKNDDNRLDWRIGRWSAALDLVKEAPVFGYGRGTEVPLLKKSYYERKMYFSYINGMNAHNQYISFLINSGIAGLSVYVATLLWGLRHSIKARDILLLSFITLIIIVSWGENLLDVNKGIFFYGFFFTFFMFSKPGFED